MKRLLTVVYMWVSRSRSQAAVFTRARRGVALFSLVSACELGCQLGSQWGCEWVVSGVVSGLSVGLCSWMQVVSDGAECRKMSPFSTSPRSWCLFPAVLSYSALSSHVSHYLFLLAAFLVQLKPSLWWSEGWKLWRARLISQKSFLSGTEMLKPRVVLLRLFEIVVEMSLSVPRH